ncbi:MAG: T9SS type A sorting domain-containing protein [Bacteroidales bacterium]|jgi:hypothetical protein|nr:T9SS type A sorting domain-containing protein [Bacteroidales bacterium]
MRRTNFNKLWKGFCLLMMFSAGNLSAQNFIEGLSGSGTEGDPVLISGVEDLRTLSAFVMNDVNYSTATAGKHFKLTNDIFFSEPIYDFDDDGVAESNFIPIGGRSGMTTKSDYRLFQGIFDGDGHIIYGLKIRYSGVDYVGLFGITWGASIKNVGIEDGYFEGGGCVAALCGQLNSSSSIEACFARSCNVSGTFLYTGGLCGATYSNSVINNAYVSLVGVSGTDFVGGFCGNNAPNSVIKNSYSVADVTTTNNSSYYGGFCGYSTADAAIINCFYLDTWQQSQVAEPGLFSQRGEAKAWEELSDSTFNDTLNSGQDMVYWKDLQSNQLYYPPILYWEENPVGRIHYNCYVMDVTCEAVTINVSVEPAYPNMPVIISFGQIGPWYILPSYFFSTKIFLPDTIQAGSLYSFEYTYEGLTQNTEYVYCVWYNFYPASYLFPEAIPFTTQECNSLLEIEETSLSIYPNPATDNIFIDIKSTKNTTALIYDVFGGVVMKKENTNMLNIASLPSGNYMLVVKSEGRIAGQKKIIKK